MYGITITNELYQKLMGEPTLRPAMKAVDALEDYLRYDAPDAPEELRRLVETARDTVHRLAYSWRERNEDFLRTADEADRCQCENASLKGQVAQLEKEKRECLA